MDRLQWLKDMTEKNQQDAGGWFWLGKEYASQGQWIQALGAYTEGLKVSGEDMKAQFVMELSHATQQLQKQSPIPGETVFEKEGLQHEEDVPEFGRAPFTGESVQPKVKAHPGLQLIQGGKSPEPQVPVPVSSITFADVAGLKDLKKAIQMRIISPFYNQGLFSKFRKKAGGGVLLYGPPGCGKTFIARATAGECKATFVNVHITDILDPYIGVSEQNLKDLFDKARYQKPSIMFFDEIDAVGFNRSKSSSHLRGLVDTFLTQMEGMDTTTEQVLIIGATNMPWDVDNALKRPGRFDRLIFVAPPDEEARTQIFQLKLKDRYIGPMDYSRLGKLSEFFSGADIDNVCERAAENVLEEIMDSGVERPIQMRDLEVALNLVQPSTLEWLRTAKNYVKYANQSGLYNDVEDYLKKHGKRI